MLRDTVHPINNQPERPSESGSATGQKDYALAWKRAKQLRFTLQPIANAPSIGNISTDEHCFSHAKG